MKDGREGERQQLIGRGAESEALERLVTAARGGHGGAIVVHGEPGAGKSALLEQSSASAHDFQVLRTVGNEAEMELPFAALQRLCAPGLGGVAQLPAPQRDALEVTFGLTSGPAPDRLLVGLAVQNLFCELARKRPLLGIVDDAQWLDRASSQAVAFVARRLTHESVAMEVGARIIPDEMRGLPSLRVDGLDRRDARSLLASALPDRVDEVVLERIVAETRGNPLALLELPRGLTPAQLAGGFGLPVATPLTGRIEESFRRRLTRLPAESRLLLLAAAADPTGDPMLLWRAADLLGLPDSAADALEAEGLLQQTTTVTFRHPLVRSAVYGAASAKERRAVHRALADATDASADPDRKAWHRAQATARPDEDVAAELERSAERAHARGGFAAAAAFMERAAELTTDRRRRAGRALVAAEAKRQAGALEAALGLAAVAERGPLDGSQRAQLDVLRAQISFGTERGNEAPPLLLKAARALEHLDARRARDTYLDALTAALFAGRLALGANALEVATAARTAPRPAGAPRASDLLLDGLAVLITDGPVAGVPILQLAFRTFREDDSEREETLRWSWLAGRAAAFVWDYDTWDVLTARQLQVARAAGALSVLPLTLSTRAGRYLFAGEFSVASSLIEEVEEVADATDNRTVPYGALAFAAFRGRERAARDLIDSTTADFMARGEGMGLSLAEWATAVLYNGLARYGEAFAAAERALEDPDELWFSPWATVELIEAASRMRDPRSAEAAYARLEAGTGASGTDWGRAVEARCRGLLSDCGAAEAYFREAVDVLTPTPLRLDLARTRLVYGEWLRRERRPAEARDQLRLAHQMFTDFGLEGFTERARVELRATGEQARKRTADTGSELTPREAQIADLAARGGSNQEIAAQLFISSSTVEYHLHKVFLKLGVRSRAQLAARVADSGPR